MIHFKNLLNGMKYFWRGIELNDRSKTNVCLTHSAYRPDIDGLRAVAILSVVIFHAFPEKMPGGFIGVDIFFVISGFLISSIIFSNLDHNAFSLVEFYVRRIRRIFPALILVLISCLVFGWIFLFPDEYMQLGKHTAAGAGFIQNFILLYESGYFDNTAETKPLLHFWSLAVEEQFYIFWPLLLALIWKRNGSFLRIAALIAIVSFAANIYLIFNGRVIAAFYLPFPRLWELIMGAILAYTALRCPQRIEKYKDIQSFLGFVIILAGFIVLNKERHFPGFWALLPTIGTFLILSAGPNSRLNHKVLANKAMIWIGLISYPLYLWHWPMLSFLHIMEGNASNLLKMTTVVGAIFLAWLTYHFVEQPIRLGKKPKRLAVSLVMSMGLIFVVGVTNYKFDILKRSDERTEYTAYFDNTLPNWRYHTREKILETYRADCDFYDLDKYRIGQATSVPRSTIHKSCFTRLPSYRHSILLWGDSHAQQLYYGLKNNLPNDWQILLGVSSGCVANPDIKGPSNSNYCDQSNWKTLQTIEKAKPDVVIVGQASGHTISKMRLITRKLKHMGVKKIIFTGPVPQWNVPLHKIIARNLWKDTPRRTFVGINQDIIKRNHQIAANFKATNDILFIDLIHFFCNDQGCLTYIGKDKKRGITTFDYGHLTPIASDALAKSVLVAHVIS